MNIFLGVGVCLKRKLGKDLAYVVLQFGLNLNIQLRTKLHLIKNIFFSVIF